MLTAHPPINEGDDVLDLNEKAWSSHDGRGVARLLLLIAGWAAAAAIALLVGALFNLPKLLVLFTGGVIWTWLLLLQ
jgi:hypothetical protein